LPDIPHLYDLNLSIWLINFYFIIICHQLGCSLPGITGTSLHVHSPRRARLSFHTRSVDPRTPPRLLLDTRTSLLQVTPGSEVRNRALWTCARLRWTLNSTSSRGYSEERRSALPGGSQEVSQNLRHPHRATHVHEAHETATRVEPACTDTCHRSTPAFETPRGAAGRRHVGRRTHPDATTETQLLSARSDSYFQVAAEAADVTQLVLVGALRLRQESFGRLSVIVGLEHGRSAVGVTRR